MCDCRTRWWRRWPGSRWCRYRYRYRSGCGWRWWRGGWSHLHWGRGGRSEVKFVDLRLHWLQLQDGLRVLVVVVVVVDDLVVDVVDVVVVIVVVVGSVMIP